MNHFFSPIFIFPLFTDVNLLHYFFHLYWITVSNSNSVHSYGYSIDSSVSQPSYCITAPTKHHHHHQRYQKMSSFNHSQSPDISNNTTTTTTATTTNTTDLTNSQLSKSLHLLENTFELTNVSNKLILFKTKLDYSNQQFNDLYNSVSSKLLKNLKKPPFQNSTNTMGNHIINNHLEDNVDRNSNDLLLQHQTIVADSSSPQTIPYINSPFTIRGIHIMHHSNTLDHSEHF